LTWQPLLKAKSGMGGGDLIDPTGSLASRPERFALLGQAETTPYYSHLTRAHYAKRRLRLDITVLKHLNLLDGHKSALHHVVQNGKETINLFFGIDDLYHNGQVLREA
jgi:hypothetical protein